MTARLGQRQQCLLHDMRLYRANHWVSRVADSRFTQADRNLLEGLHTRGLVTGVSRYASLTPVGQRVADRIIADVWGREPIPAGDTIVLVTPNGPNATRAMCSGCCDDRGVRWVCHVHGHTDEADTLACAQRHAQDHRTEAAL